MADKESKFIPGKETEEQFEQVLNLLSEWIKAGLVEIDVDTDGDVDFTLPDEMEELLETQIPEELTRRNVEAIIASEIPAIIAAGLSKNKKNVIRNRTPKELEEDFDVLLERSKKAIGKLISKEIKERVLLRKATSSYVIENIRWKKGTYHIEENEKGKEIDVPYVSMEMNLSRPHSYYTIAFSPTQGISRIKRSDDIAVTLDLHIDDIKNMTKKLNDIVNKLG
ncbi:MAG: hypothetical protein KAT56_10920 [Sedimentisphaerales bacterium]|nr:hypothetical protein [Sedimentisphaerales bacterium]